MSELAAIPSDELPSEYYGGFPAERLDNSRQYVLPIYDRNHNVVGLSIPDKLPFGVHPFELPPFTFLHVAEIIPDDFFTNPNGIYPFLNLSLTPITGGYDLKAVREKEEIKPLGRAKSLWRSINPSKEQYAINRRYTSSEVLKVAWQVYKHLIDYPYLSEYVLETRSQFKNSLNPGKIDATGRFTFLTLPAFAVKRHRIDNTAPGRYLGLDKELQQLEKGRTDYHNQTDDVEEIRYLVAVPPGTALSQQIHSIVE